MRPLSQVKYLAAITRTAFACGTPSACRRPGAVGSHAAQLAHQVLKSLISALSRAEIWLFYAQDSPGDDLRSSKPAKEVKRMLQMPNKAGPEDRAGVERPLSPNPSPPRPSGDDGVESHFLLVRYTKGLHV